VLTAAAAPAPAPPTLPPRSPAWRPAHGKSGQRGWEEGNDEGRWLRTAGKLEGMLLLHADYFFLQKHNIAASWAILLQGLLSFKAEAKSMVSPPKVYWQAFRIIKHRHNQAYYSSSIKTTERKEKQQKQALS